MCFFTNFAQEEKKIMTNREIKFELARIALERCNFSTSESLTENLMNLYDWILEEPETCIEEQRDNIDTKELLSCIRTNTGSNSGIAEMLTKVFNANDIKSVDDLLKIGRGDFSKYRTVGRKSILAIDDALYELGIKGW